MGKDRKPWNPFPLHSLAVEGLSACAKSVLMYLAARSNYEGQTCVGHRRMCHDLVRSKDFVTKGLAELERKGFVSSARRGRRKHQADWRTLSAALILKSRITNSSPEEQDCNAGSSPDSGNCSPAQQGETCQINSNLADQDSNLAVINNKEYEPKTFPELMAQLDQEFGKDAW